MQDKLSKILKIKNSIKYYNNSSSNNIAPAQSPLPKPTVADTAATANFFEESTTHSKYAYVSIPIKNKQIAQKPITVLLPNNDTMQSTHTAELDLPDLPPQARLVHIFPKLASGSLISIGTLCDAGCSALFRQQKLYIFNPKGRIIIQGTRQQSKLWTIDPVNKRPTHSLSAIIDAPTIAERIAFYHASLFSPTLSTLCKAIDANYLTTFPNFTSKQVRKYPPSTIATAKGHMNAHRANIKSTKNKHAKPYSLFNSTETPTLTPLPHIIPSDTTSPSRLYHNTQQHHQPNNQPHLIPPIDDADSLPTIRPQHSPPFIPPQQIPPPTQPAPSPATETIPPRQAPPPMPSVPAPAVAQPSNTSMSTSPHKTHYVYSSCAPITGQIYSDQTGKFIIPSSRGNNYLFLLYDYDSNSIHAETIPNRTKETLLEAYTKIITILKQRGLQPKLQRLDNECSALMAAQMDKEGIDYQLTPAGLHRRNAAEKAIQTYKNHFIAGLCTTHPNFPLNQWDRLIPQATITLNLLRPSRINPNLSAYAQVYGAFDYNRTPLAPPGIQVLAHVKPKDRKSWGTHAEKGFYLGPALQHYRCHNVWVTRTAAQRIIDTIKWLPHGNIKMPYPSRESLILAAINDLTAAIRTNTDTSLLPPMTMQSHQTLTQLANLFNSKEQTMAPSKSNPSIMIPAAPPPRVPQQLQTLATPLPRVPTGPSTPNIPLPRVPPATTPVTTSELPPRRSPRLALLQQAAKELLKTNNITPSAINYLTAHESLNAVLNQSTGKMEEYRHLLQGPDRDKWLNAASKEFARISQGRAQNDTPFTDTVIWLHPDQLPPDKRATYMRICANYRPQKDDPYRIRCTIGGNRIIYLGPTRTPAADLTLFKLFLNSVISTKNAKFMNIDLKDFYLSSYMDEPEYMLVPFKHFPPDIVKHYQLDKLVKNGLVLAKVIKGMYGLPQAGRLAYDQLTKHLALAGYTPTEHTPGLFKHTTRDIQFILIVDDFGIKYKIKGDVDHLIQHLKKKYDLTMDWEGTTFCGIKLKWDYVTNPKSVQLAIPGYVARARKRFNHQKPSKPQHSPHQWTPPSYGAKIQMATTQNPDFQKLTPAQQKFIQEFVGVFLFYGRAIDSTMLPALGTIATHLHHAPYDTLKQKVDQFLDYAATHPDATIKYIASEMHLWAHTDASYLSETKARSRAGGYFFLSDKPALPIKADSPEPTPNMPVHVLCKIIDAVMSSAQEAETGAGFLNAKEAIPMRQALEDLGHPQGPTPLQFDNKVANGILNDDIIQKRSKAMDMQFYWLRDRIRQLQFHAHWKRGPLNKGDYPSKHHPTKHHIEVRPQYVLNSLLSLVSTLQGCAKSRYSSIAPNEPLQRAHSNISPARIAGFKKHCNIKVASPKAHNI